VDMDRLALEESESRFASFIGSLNEVIGHRDRIGVIAHPRHELVHYAASTEPPARQVRMAAKALRPRSIPVSITEQTAA